jgi:transposase
MALSKSEAAQVFQISRNTIDLWLKRRTETGDYQAKRKYRPGNGHKITDWDKFREFVKRMEIRLKLRWQHCGQETSAPGRFRVRSTRWA